MGPLKPNSNAIQLNPNCPGSRSFNKQKFKSSDLELTELSHLRTSSADQVRLTLDYFENNLDKLSDPTLQIYLECNFFEPGLLLETIAQDPSILERLDQFFKESQKLFSEQSNVSHTTLFLIRLQYLANMYTKRPSELMDLQRNISLLITKTHKMDNAKAIQSTLYHYQFMAILVIKPN